MARITIEYGGGVRKIIRTEAIVEINETPAVEAGWDEEMGERIYPSPLTVEIVTLAPDSFWEDGGDYPDRARVEIRPYIINLYGENARDFLTQYANIERRESN